MSRKSSTGPLVWPPVHRAPIVTGITGGVGASTVGTVLGSGDRGLYRAGLSVDVLVCRSTAASVLAAQIAVQSAPGTPVLVVVADAPGKKPKTAASRMVTVGAHTSAVVFLPWVEYLRDLDTPAHELAAAIRAAETPKWAQEARVAVAELLAALVPLLRAPDPNQRLMPRGSGRPVPPTAHPRGGFTAPTTFHT